MPSITWNSGKPDADSGDEVVKVHDTDIRNVPLRSGYGWRGTMLVDYLGAEITLNQYIMQTGHNIELVEQGGSYIVVEIKQELAEA